MKGPARLAWTGVWILALSVATASNLFMAYAFLGMASGRSTTFYEPSRTIAFAELVLALLGMFSLTALFVRSLRCQ